MYSPKAMAWRALSSMCREEPLLWSLPFLRSPAQWQGPGWTTVHTCPLAKVSDGESLDRNTVHPDCHLPPAFHLMHGTAWALEDICNVHKYCMNTSPHACRSVIPPGKPRDNLDHFHPTPFSRYLEQYCPAETVM
jgi:hypothetical protein